LLLHVLLHVLLCMLLRILATAQPPAMAKEVIHIPLLSRWHVRPSSRAPSDAACRTASSYIHTTHPGCCRCKQGTLQFVFAKPILAAITLLLYAFGHYEDGDWSYKGG
jgi:hypothetical protein